MQSSNNIYLLKNGMDIFLSEHRQKIIGDAVKGYDSKLIASLQLIN